MSDDDLPPELDDFTEVIDKIKIEDDNKNNDKLQQDYTKTREEIEQQFQKQVQSQLQQKMVNQQLEEMKKQEEQAKKAKEQEKQQKQQSKSSKSKNSGGLFGGMQKGFLGGGGSKKSQPKKQEVQKQKIEEVKYNKEKAEKNSLEFQDVQQAMNMKDFMNNNKDQWMTPDLLNKIAQNEKLQKLFTNPQYLAAINMMQKEPKKAMEQYGNNPEFMMLFQEFCKIMGTHFEGMQTEENKKKNTQQQQQKAQEPQKPLIQEIKKPTKEDIEQQEFAKKIEDPQVKEILADPKVQQLIAYIQKTGQLDFRQIAARDPQLAMKLQILINKGVMNMQPG